MGATIRGVWARLKTARVALLAAGLSYYFVVGLLPILVLASGVFRSNTLNRSMAPPQWSEFLVCCGPRWRSLAPCAGRLTPCGGSMMLVGVGFTAALAGWFVARLGSSTPDRQAALVATAVLTVGLEAAKYGAGLGVPRLVSRESALYGSLGAALGLLAVVLLVSWLLLIATAIAAELSTSRIDDDPSIAGTSTEGRWHQQPQ